MCPLSSLTAMEAKWDRVEQRSDEIQGRREDRPQPNSQAGHFDVPAVIAGIGTPQPLPPAMLGSAPPPLPPIGNEITSSAVGTHSRRAPSEATLPIPDDLDIVSGDTYSSGFEDDPFSTYMDMEKIGSKSEAGGSMIGAGNANLPLDAASHWKHRQNSSADGSITLPAGCRIDEIGERKKTMPPERLAELAATDPKRARRILANRESAARSKARKARHILELERKVQALKAEVAAISTGIDRLHRYLGVLSSENSGLRLRCQYMQKQAQLSYALTVALGEEVERLKRAMGKTLVPDGDFNADLRHVSYPPPLTAPPFPNMHGQQLPTTSSGQPNLHWQQNALETFQGLQINNSSPTISTSGSSSTF